MRILYLTQWFEPEPAFKGSAFAKALREAGHEVEVVTGFPNYPGGKVYAGYRLRPFYREVVDGILVRRLLLWPSHDRSVLGRAANYLSFFLTALVFCLLNMRRFDLVYVYHPPITPAFAAALAGMVWKVPFVVDIQDLWPDSVAASGMGNVTMLRAIDRICGLVYRHAAHIVCQSEGMSQRLIERRVAPEKITRVYNWSNYRRAESECAPIPPHIALALSGRLNVVYGGNIGQAQALETLIEAAVIANRVVPAIRLHIVGNGIERSAILAAAAGASDIVRVHEAVPRDTMDRIFEESDILALHLKNDPLFEITVPSKLQHYLSVGKPVIAGIGGEAARLLMESGAARVAPPDDATALSRCLVEVAQLTPAERLAMGARGSRFYAKRLGFEAGMQSTLDCLAHSASPQPATMTDAKSSKVTDGRC
jgi:colanic acid biosynthesis glycosyl transferase WcaI